MAGKGDMAEVANTKEGQPRLEAIIERLSIARAQLLRNANRLGKRVSEIFGDLPQTEAAEDLPEPASLLERALHLITLIDEDNAQMCADLDRFTEED